MQKSYQHGQCLQEWLSQHEQTVNVIANVVNIWQMDSLAFTVEYDDSVCWIYLNLVCSMFWIQ
jgi:hypothetical protein